MPITTRGLQLILNYVFRFHDRPTRYYVVLCTDDVAPTHATLSLGELVMIQSGNGYIEGGYALTPSALDFRSITADNTAQTAAASIKAVSWVAAGGNIPPAGFEGAFYVVLTTDEAVIADRQVMWYASLQTVRSALVGQTLSINNMQIRMQGGGMIRNQQRGVVTMTGFAVTGTATITAVDPAKSTLSFLGSSSDAPGDGDTRCDSRLTLTNATTVTATRTFNAFLAGTLSVGFEVTEYF